MLHSYNQFQVKSKVDYKDFAEDVETKFDTSNYKVDRPLPIGNNKKVIEEMMSEFGGRIMKEFVRPKMHRYLVSSKKNNKSH